MPPSKDFMGLASEYIHTAISDDSEPEELRTLAQRTFDSLKCSAKSGPRRTVRFSLKLRCVDQIVKVIVGNDTQGVGDLRSL